ncbi:hypothetical protein L3X38_033506 [Prunus dulcis]|uniref:Uncharacterized protein n=1 Tax=Prunus dulcis TaxID=3755 RepID=A0AAD4VHA7_PRUDU|nr:hypothetical protein L3X38_033506 [Prunus dulcis]
MDLSISSRRMLLKIGSPKGCQEALVYCSKQGINVKASHPNVASVKTSRYKTKVAGEDFSAQDINESGWQGEVAAEGSSLLVYLRKKCR